MNAKQIAAQAAVRYIRDGMTIGLGTGSTAGYAIAAIGKMVQEGLTIHAVASSLQSESLATKAGIRIVPFSQLKSIDLYIDGADEVDKDLNLMKGGGGALLREKILAYHSKAFVVIVDSSKLVSELGTFSLPVEVTPFAIELTMGALKQLQCNPVVRKKGNADFITDNGNNIIDCAFLSISDVSALSRELKSIPGVVENGLFLHTMVSEVIIGYEDGHLETRL